MRRKNRVDLYAEAPTRGNFDECPMLEIGIEPQLHLSRNEITQPFFLICEKDCVIAQLHGTARLEFRNASVNYFDLVLGDFVYVPGGTPHRILPTSPSLHLRYKAEHPGLEGVAWFSPKTGSEIARVVWDCAIELPQEGYQRACSSYNRSAAMRTCPDTGSVLPPIDMSPFTWDDIAKEIREAEAFERQRAEKRGVVVPPQEPRAPGDLVFRPPPTHTEPARVNIYEFVRIATTQLNPMFPYLGPGCIVPCSAMHDPEWKNAMGYFIHENTVNEVNLCFGAVSNFRASGAVFVGPMQHGVGQKPDPDFSGEKHGVGEKRGNEDRPDMIAIQVIAQRQAVDQPQREAFSIVCEGCESELCRYPYDAHAFPDPVENVPDTRILGLPTISQDAWIVERINADETLRTCGKCGHVNPKFPTSYWGWADYRRRTHVVLRARKLMAETAEKAMRPVAACSNGVAQNSA